MIRKVKAIMKGIVIKPWVYFIPCVICLLFWFIGTAVQMQTSEAWMMGTSTAANLSTLSVFMQIGYMVHGQLNPSYVVPFIFATAVQVALLVGSFGLELPKEPAWRHNSAWIVIVLMIFINGCGDWQYAAPYGVWGQAGFSLAIMFLTAVCGFLTIVCAMHGLRKMQATAPSTARA